MSLLDSKKGQYRNYLASIVLLFVFGFISIFSYMLLNNILTGLAASPIYDSNMAAVGNNFLNVLKIFDYIIVLIMVSLIAAVGYTSYRINSRPIFFIITLITTPFLGFISFFFNYVFSMLVSDATLNVALGYFRLTLLICTNLHWVMLILICVGAITLYGKRNQEVAL